MLELPRTVSAEFLKNQVAEPAFLHWLFAQVVQLGRIPVDEALDCGATIAHVSQVTAARYLKKATCKVGLYLVIEEGDGKQRFVEFRPEWASFRKTEEAKRKLDQYARNWRNAILDGIPGISKKRVANRQASDANLSTSESPQPP